MRYSQRKFMTVIEGILLKKDPLMLFSKISGFDLSYTTLEKVEFKL